MLLLRSMKNRGFIFVGVLGILLLVVSVIVFRVSGASDSTYVEGCTPYNIDIQKQETSSVKVSWETKDKCSAYVLYGEDISTLDMVAVDLVNETSSKHHSVIIERLVSSKEYYFSIVSDDINYGKDGLPIRFSISSL